MMMEIINMRRLMMMGVLMTMCVAVVMCDDDFYMSNDLSDSMMPGVRTLTGRGGRGGGGRGGGSHHHHRWARTPPTPADTRILFPGDFTGADVPGGDLPGADVPGGDLPGGDVPGGDVLGDDVLELPTNITELDVFTLNRLNSISDISDFAQLFNLELPQTEDTGDVISPRVGSSITDQGKDYPMANCNPELKSVVLDLPLESNTMFFPTCIRLEQCGGCCFGPLLTCRPKMSEVVKVKVVKVTSSAVTSSGRGRGGRGRRRRQQPSTTYDSVDVVKHTACECGCKTRAEDCNSEIHSYFEGECSCVCKNKDEKSKCEKQNTTKYWDNKTCNCYCRKPLECGSGEFFNQLSCGCERSLAVRIGGISFGSEGVEIPTAMRNKPRHRKPKPVRVPLK